MNHSNTLAGFLGISPLSYSSSFDTDEPYISCCEEPATTTVNPCTGLPLISDDSMIDVGGNVHGTCDDNDFHFSDISTATVDDFDSMNLLNNTDSAIDDSWTD